MQITASVTFLPLLSDRCSFDLLVYTNAESAVPMEWCATSFQIMTTDITSMRQHYIVGRAGSALIPDCAEVHIYPADGAEL